MYKFYKEVSHMDNKNQQGIIMEQMFPVDDNCSFRPINENKDENEEEKEEN